MGTPDNTSFSAADYVVFIASLLISLGIGIYHWWKSRGLDNKDFLLGNRKMSPLPVAISLFAGIVSAVSILGNPSEMYFYGSQLWINCLGTGIGTILAGLLVVPVLYPLKLVSLYEILERRWRSTVPRKLATLLQLFHYITFLGIALYAPSLALSVVTPIPLAASVVVLGLVCTVYASMGGAKAVVYTDTVQAFIMLAGILAVIIKGCAEVGGGAASWKIDEDHGRIEFFNMSSDPLIRHTFMSTIILGTYHALNVFGAGQAQYQRWASVSTMKNAYAVIALSSFLLIAVWSLINYSGLVLFSVYADCDPYTMGYITKTDQIIIYFVIDKLGYLQGIPGLFVAAIYSGVLSTVSSVLNAIAAMIWEDLFRGFGRFSKFSPLEEKKATIVISSVTGVIATILGLTVGNMGGLFQMTYSLLGAIGGPVTGLILTAVTCPWVKSKSAIAGVLLALILNMWMVMGNYLYAPPTEKLPLSTDGCPQTNVTEGTTPFSTTTLLSSTTTDGGGDSGSDVFPLYLVSYCLYGAIGTLTAIVVANVATLIFGPQAISKVPKETVHKQSLQFYEWAKSLCGKSNSRSNSKSSIAKENENFEISKVAKENENFEISKVAKENENFEISKVVEASKDRAESLCSSTKSSNKAEEESQKGSVNLAFEVENHL
ncbi:sodium-coupled monocarboxylate transporter 1-like [Palaemon carinicauda]|uniref:sodium-coupled monocarboxylate transporter 1-like n=1 Tax=Palaemon carinicauda TaxID=392227 RepID=UPI0035B64287